MHFRIPQRDLARLLQAAQGVVERKSTMRILECVLIEADGEGVQIVATDLDVGTRLRAAAEVKEAGAVCLPARKLHEIVRLLPAEPVEVRAREGGRVDVKCGSSSFRLPGLARDEYPALPQVGEGPVARLPREALGGMIARVAFAITTDDSRYALNGCLLSITKGVVRLVSSDGHRLACVTQTLEGGGRRESRSRRSCRRRRSESWRGCAARRRRRRSRWRSPTTRCCSAAAGAS